MPKNQPMSSTRRKKLVFSYLPDWILTILLAVLFFMLNKVEGFRRAFSLEDTSLRYPYAVHERVPNTYLYIIAFVAPLVLMPLINLATIRSLWDLHNSTLGLILGLSITGAFTQIVKITIGRPRPDIISRCNPPAGLSDPLYGLTTSAICTQTDAGIMRDGFRSCFSGHSSLSFAGLGFLSFYLAGKLHLFDKRGHTSKAWLAVAPFMGAALVAISRTMDYRHHWHDVLLGSAVGTLFAYFSYRQYYPTLESPLSHCPHSPRIRREEDQVLPTHNDGEHSSRRKTSSSRHEYVNIREDYELEPFEAEPSDRPLEEPRKEHEEEDEDEANLTNVPVSPVRLVAPEQAESPPDSTSQPSVVPNASPSRINHGS